MNFKDRDFISTLIEGLKLKGINLSEPVILTQRIYLSSIRSFYGYSSETMWFIPQFLQGPASGPILFLHSNISVIIQLLLFLQ